MIDTHAHLTKRFCDPTENIEQGINKIKIVLAASNVEESKENIELAKKNSNLFASVGIHPQATDPDNKLSVDEQLDLLDKLAKNAIAIGETGLDYSPVLPNERERGKKEQEKLFRGQIGLALKHKLPLIIHARKAVDEVISIISEYDDLVGVFHCYAGGKKRIRRVLELGNGWYFGIDGNITYEVGLSDVVVEIPQDRLVAETDSPFLTPIPHRGETNKPEYVKFVYKKIAEIWEKSFEEAEKILDKNAKALFDIV